MYALLYQGFELRLFTIDIRKVKTFGAIADAWIGINISSQKFPFEWPLPREGHPENFPETICIERNFANDCLVSHSTVNFSRKMGSLFWPKNWNFPSTLVTEAWIIHKRENRTHVESPTFFELIPSEVKLCGVKKLPPIASILIYETKDPFFSWREKKKKKISISSSVTHRNFSSTAAEKIFPLYIYKCRGCWWMDLRETLLLIIKSQFRCTRDSHWQGRCLWW